jgi:hypothetical protein
MYIESEGDEGRPDRAGQADGGQEKKRSLSVSVSGISLATRTRSVARSLGRRKQLIRMNERCGSSAVLHCQAGEWASGRVGEWVSGWWW